MFYCFENPRSNFGKVIFKIVIFIIPRCSQGRRLWSQRHVPQAEFLIVRHQGMLLKDQGTFTNCTGALLTHYRAAGRPLGCQFMSDARQRLAQKVSVVT